MIRDFLFLLCGALCHQLPERSLAVAGHTLPLCARCTGSTTGAFSCILFLAVAKRFNGNKPPRTDMAILLAISVLPLAIDGSASFFGLHDSPAYFRLFTGLLTGYIFPILIVLLANFNEKSDNRIPIINGVKDIAVILGIAALCLVIVLSSRGIYFFWLISAIVSAGMVVCIYSVIPWFLFRAIFKNTQSWLLKASAFVVGLLLTIFIANVKP